MPVILTGFYTSDIRNIEFRGQTWQAGGGCLITKLEVTS